MKTTQGWGWLAAGVLALGLNGFYYDGGAAWAHGIADRVAEQSKVLVDMASAQGDRILQRAHLVAVRDETASCRLATAMARFQTKVARTQTGMARFEAMSARQEAAFARMEARRAQMEAQVARIRLAPVGFRSQTILAGDCPRVRVNIPRVNISKMQW